MRLLTLSVLFALLPYALTSPVFHNSTVHNGLDSRAPSSSKSVIIQMFEWNWDSIAAECTNFIGPAGYGYVQVSPPQEHIKGSQWWTDYQPVSYILTSKRGNRDQLRNMISTCHAAGVKVIVDTIFNHMAGIDSGTGTAGSSFTQYVYPGIYQYQDFHHCGLTKGNDIVDYSNRYQVQNCELVNLSDLATETEYVRSRLAAYANDLLSLGVDGLRLDAAKHIPAGDLANIVNRLSRRPYITSEVIWGGGEPIQPSEYTGISDVQEFRYTTALKDSFLGGGISNLQNLEKRGWVSGSQANVFVANHDTERNGASLTVNSPSNTYINSHVFSLAHPYGTPTILSSYSFRGHEEGAPNGGAASCSSTGGSGGWLCQHRYIAISGMVGFRNNVGSAGLTNWVSPQPNRIAFGRGALGFVAINNADSAWSTTFSTSLPSGSYCDVISGKGSSGACTGNTISVSNGQFTITVPARSAVAIHTGATSSSPGTVDPGNGNPNPGPASVTFQVTATTTWGQDIFLVGSLSQLGSWTAASAVALSSANYPLWSATVSMPVGTSFEYKFIKKNSDGSINWESDPNRQATASEGVQTLSQSWR